MFDIHLRRRENKELMGIYPKRLENYAARDESGFDVYVLNLLLPLLYVIAEVIILSFQTVLHAEVLHQVLSPAPLWCWNINF